MKKLFGFFTLVLLVSCSNPEIVINNPSEGQTYGTEWMIPVNATITDPDGIKRVTFKYENHTGDFWPGGATTYTLEEMGTMYAYPAGHEEIVTVEAEDMHGNTGSESVTIEHN